MYTIIFADFILCLCPNLKFKFLMTVLLDSKSFKSCILVLCKITIFEIRCAYLHLFALMHYLIRLNYRLLSLVTIMCFYNLIAIVRVICVDLWLEVSRKKVFFVKMELMKHTEFGVSID